MNNLFQRANPEGNLADPRKGVKVAKRRRETLTQPERRLQFRKGGSGKRYANENKTRRIDLRRFQILQKKACFTS